MRSTLPLIFVLTAGLLLPGCVAKKKYVALESDLATTNARVVELETALSESEMEEAATQARLAKSAETVQRLTMEVQQANKEQKRLEKALAETLNDKSKLTSSVEEMQAALAENANRRAQAERRLSQYRDLTAKFKALIDAGTLRVEIVDGRMVVQLSSDVLFQSGSAKLNEAGAENITQVAEVLKYMSERQLQIEGHTDNVPIKTKEYSSNWELGFARAMSVVRTMEAAGVPKTQMSAVSYGEFRPRSTNETPEGRTANRRIQIVLVPDLTILPGFDELQRASQGTVTP